MTDYDPLVIDAIETFEADLSGDTDDSLRRARSILQYAEGLRATTDLARVSAIVYAFDYLGPRCPVAQRAEMLDMSKGGYASIRADAQDTLARAGNAEFLCPPDPQLTATVNEFSHDVETAQAAGSDVPLDGATAAHSDRDGEFSGERPSLVANAEAEIDSPYRTEFTPCRRLQAPVDLEGQVRSPPGEPINRYSLHIKERYPEPLGGHVLHAHRVRRFHTIDALCGDLKDDPRFDASVEAVRGQLTQLEAAIDGAYDMGT